MRLVRSRVVVVAAALAVGVVGGALGTAVATTGTASSAAAAKTAAYGPGPMTGAGDMMGGGEMMGGAPMMAGMPGAGGGGAGLVPAARMEALAAVAARQATVNGRTVTYRSSKVTLVALGAPGNRPGMFWQIDGLVNPTVRVPAGATITVRFADGDAGHPHGFEVTTATPPFPRMAMMAGQVGAPGAFIMPVPAPHGASWYSATTTFRAPPAGTYYYLCPVPGHAQQGMWGKLIVR